MALRGAVNGTRNVRSFWEISLRHPQAQAVETLMADGDFLVSGNVDRDLDADFAFIVRTGLEQLRANDFLLEPPRPRGPVLPRGCPQALAVTRRQRKRRCAVGSVVAHAVKKPSRLADRRGWQLLFSLTGIEQWLSIQAFEQPRPHRRPAIESGKKPSLSLVDALLAETDAATAASASPAPRAPMQIHTAGALSCSR